MSDTSGLKALSALKIWEDNYNEGDVMGIARSIRQFGFNNAPRVWQNDELRGGNHTVMALCVIKAEGARPDLDLDFPPVNVVVKGDEWHIPFIDVSHLDENRATAFAIADNEWARKAVRKADKLAEYLQGLADDENMLLATGYDDEAIEDLNSLIQSMEDDDRESEDEQGSEPEDIPEQWQIVIECTSEVHQAMILEQLMGEGLSCRALVS